MKRKSKEAPEKKVKEEKPKDKSFGFIVIAKNYDVGVQKQREALAAVKAALSKININVSYKEV